MRAGRRVPSPHRCIGCFQSAIFVNFCHMCKPKHQLSAVYSPRRRLDSPSEGERGVHPSPFFHGRKGFFPPAEHKLSSRRKAYFPPLGKINYPSAEPFRLLANNKILLAVRGATDNSYRHPWRSAYSSDNSCMPYSTSYPYNDRLRWRAMRCRTGMRWRVKKR